VEDKGRSVGGSCECWNLHWSW